MMGVREITSSIIKLFVRSEERRVGKECKVQC